ncbi:NadR type nicotinamide-nucleotide adenylyltransferase [Chitinophaga skermanii]|uniref:NadR type nicotinamide-nucleotide adenylyltransferase n=1 Tax=Chitinophaga skermanii TaxID=331697 RepID=A0A327Q662_9BACT|nr:ATP-binding protein [Chitinophaga skermanii]RAI98692.1 NadR type nicotinamide-nucleotide adenylyltransferase [Chitinophaga skermanii]
MKKIVVIGGESTGKSTLSAQLAEHYGTVWVPEFARGYIDALNRLYEQHDLYTIAKGQLASEDELAQQANNWLVCDTDLHVIKVWSEAKYGECDAKILELIANRQYDGYLLTYIDIPWSFDPQREHPEPEARAYFYNIYRDIVINSGLPWADIRGDYDERLRTAINFMDSLK